MSSRAALELHARREGRDDGEGLDRDVMGFEMHSSTAVEGRAGLSNGQRVLSCSATARGGED